jgi:Tfp pilus assembly protein PilF
MSLLMKALEKAAKDRGESTQPVPTPGAAASPPGTTAPAAAASRAATAAATSAASKMELALEPLTADTPELDRAPAPAPAATPAAKPAAGAKKTGDQARAATVLQATSSAPEAAVTSRRVKPVILIGGLAGIAIIAFGIYVYLQITNPGLFIRQPPPSPVSPLTQTPAPKPPIATQTLVAPAGTPAVVAPPPAATTASVAAEAPAPAAPQAASPPVARAETPRDSIKVSAGSAEPQLDSRLTSAYGALQSGKIDEARQMYAEVLRSDGKNIQGLLGAAAVSMQQNNTDEASRLYFRVLDLEPRNPYAQAGIVAMMGRADPAAAEAKLKQLIAREPIASLHFTLGNLYGDQSRWAEAQQSYFQAHQLEPANPDYAYNLAVGLEHIGQARLASGFYRRAVELAQARGRAGFNLNQAQDRIRQLAALPE